jgi:small subunit ribosomal protein S3
VGQKVHPYIFRLGTINDWKSKWFDLKNYQQYFLQDLKIKKFLQKKLGHAAIADIIIERSAGQLTITILTARPGVIIGRGGEGIEEIKRELQKFVTGHPKIQINISEIRQPDIVAALVAQNIASQIEKRMPYKRAVKQAIERAMQSKAKGIKILVKGRLNNVDIARQEKFAQGSIPLHTIRANIDYSYCPAYTTNAGTIGVKVWIYKGEVFGKEREQELAANAATAADSRSGRDFSRHHGSSDRSRGPADRSRGPRPNHSNNPRSHTPHYTPKPQSK